MQKIKYTYYFLSLNIRLYSDRQSLCGLIHMTENIEEHLGLRCVNLAIAVDDLDALPEQTKWRTYCNAFS